MNNAGYLEIKIDQGADFSIPFQVLDERNTPVSIAGATITGQIRATPQAANPAIATFTGAIVDGPNGEGQLSLTAAETSAIPVDNSIPGERALTTYVWDCEIEFADGTKQRILEGPAYISPEVTK
jgi:hypothetical protein